MCIVMREGYVENSNSHTYFTPTRVHAGLQDGFGVGVFSVGFVVEWVADQTKYNFYKAKNYTKATPRLVCV